MAVAGSIAGTVLAMPSIAEETNTAPHSFAEGAAVNITLGTAAHSAFAHTNAQPDYFLTANSRAADQGAGL